MKEQIEDERLRLMVFSSAKGLGRRVDEHLLDLYGYDRDKYTFIVPIKENFFEDGHLKVEIMETVRGKEIFFLTDIGNYNITYNMHGYTNHASPNDLFAELKDGIGACASHAERLNVIMPLLYNGRQHRRQTRENLSCGAMLRELSMLRIHSFNTFDAHDRGVEHASSLMEFNDFPTSNIILREFIKNTPVEQLRNMVFVAPDNGAAKRRNDYLNSFNNENIHREAGSFYKLRDYNNLEDGKYRIISHEYSGNDDLEGKTAIVSDDMISSGGSMFDVIDALNKKGVAHIYIMVSYCLFTKGVDRFEEYYQKGMLDGVYTTNLSYIREAFRKKEWLHICDSSQELANGIYRISNGLSLTPVLSDKSESIQLLKMKFNGKN